MWCVASFRLTPTSILAIPTSTAGMPSGPDSLSSTSATPPALPGWPERQSQLYFNTFDPGAAALDLSESNELASLLQSAGELAIPYKKPVRYRARNVVANGLRFHLLEWGEESAPLVILFHGANQTGHSWDMVGLNLSQDYHVIALD